MEDLADGEAAIRRTFAAVAPWVRSAEIPRAIGCDKRSVRVSTCFLIDDYFSRFSTPAIVIPMVLSAAEQEGLRIDYLARESSCARTLDSQAPETQALGEEDKCIYPAESCRGAWSPNRSWVRTAAPPLTETGWLTNGERSPSTARGEAMSKRVPWQPPQESARRRHSISWTFSLWDDRDGSRTWSCPMLAAVWQLIRLGLLREDGRRGRTGGLDRCLARELDELPAITRLNPRAAAFAAYTTLSALSPRFLQVELAVRTILSQFAGDETVLAQAQVRAQRDGMRLPAELVDRIRYVFVAPGETDPA